MNPSDFLELFPIPMGQDSWLETNLRSRISSYVDHLIGSNLTGSGLRCSLNASLCVVSWKHRSRVENLAQIFWACLATSSFMLVTYTKHVKKINLSLCRVRVYSFLFIIFCLICLICLLEIRDACSSKALSYCVWCVWWNLYGRFGWCEVCTSSEAFEAWQHINLPIRIHICYIYIYREKLPTFGHKNQLNVGKYTIYYIVYIYILLILALTLGSFSTMICWSRLSGEGTFKFRDLEMTWHRYRWSGVGTQKVSVTAAMETSYVFIYCMYHFH